MLVLLLVKLVVMVSTLNQSQSFLEEMFWIKWSLQVPLKRFCRWTHSSMLLDTFKTSSSCNQAHASDPIFHHKVFQTPDGWQKSSFLTSIFRQNKANALREFKFKHHINRVMKCCEQAATKRISDNTFRCNTGGNLNLNEFTFPLFSELTRFFFNT